MKKTAMRALIALLTALLMYFIAREARKESECTDFIIGQEVRVLVGGNEGATGQVLRIFLFEDRCSYQVVSRTADGHEWIDWYDSDDVEAP